MLGLIVAVGEANRASLLGALCVEKRINAALQRCLHSGIMGRGGRT